MSGAAPEAAQAAPPVKLSPKQRKALREQARRDALRAERERIEAKRASDRADTRAAAPEAAPPPAPAAVAAPPPPSADPSRTDEDRARDAGMFLRGVVMPLASFVAGFFGHRLELAAYTEAQALEDGKSWVPLMCRYPWLDSLVTWASAPARFIARVRGLAKPKPTEPAA